MATKTSRAKTQPSVRTSSDSVIVWISSDEAAQLMGIEPKTLVVWRSIQKPGQPPFYRQKHSKAVRYKRAEVDAWIESGRREF